MSKTARTTTIATLTTLLMLVGIGLWWFTPRTSHEIVIPPVMSGQR